MKVLVLLLLCAVAGGVAGSVTAWPGAAVAFSAPLPYQNTFIPPQTKAFGYSSTQYLNTFPLSYSVGVRPQFAYQVPQLSGISAVPQAYYPVAGSTYYPSSIFYPPAAGVPSFAPADSAAPAPSAPAAPMPPTSPPSFPPEQQKGDADTAVIESADFPSASQQQQVSGGPPAQSQPSAPQFPPANTFPNLPSLPQFPQGTGQVPSFPQIPQILPPGFQLPQIPSNPLFPQSPSPSPPSTFPAADGGDKGLNDEDTVAVESA